MKQKSNVAVLIEESLLYGFITLISVFFFLVAGAICSPAFAGGDHYPKTAPTATANASASATVHNHGSESGHGGGYMMMAPGVTGYGSPIVCRVGVGGSGGNGMAAGSALFAYSDDQCNLREAIKLVLQVARDTGNQMLFDRAITMTSGLAGMAEASKK